MQTFTYDILIKGAGPTGSSLALMLASQSDYPERIAVAGSLVTELRKEQKDPRSLALNQGSKAFLESINAWPEVCAPITKVHVSQKGRMGSTVIHNSDLNVDSLGDVVDYHSLIHTMHDKLQNSGVSLISYDEAGSYNARIYVVSHGGKPTGLQRAYNQSALLAMVTASQPQPGWAYERFTRQGPLALLPHPYSDNTYALVWCNKPEQSSMLLELGTSEFNYALQQQFGDRLGKLECISSRHIFPLTMHAGPQLQNTNTVAIGNAAQTLHPVAGQGLNLGLRDVAQLGIVLTPWLANPHKDPLPALEQYVRNRRADRNISMAVTDLLPRIFVTGSSLIEHACGLALMGMDIAKPIRNIFARQLMQGFRV